MKWVANAIGRSGSWLFYEAIEAAQQSNDAMVWHKTYKILQNNWLAEQINWQFVCDPDWWWLFYDAFDFIDNLPREQLIQQSVVSFLYVLFIDNAAATSPGACSTSSLLSLAMHFGINMQLVYGLTKQKPMIMNNSWAYINFTFVSALMKVWPYMSMSVCTLYIGLYISKVDLLLLNGVFIYNVILQRYCNCSFNILVSYIAHI